MSLPYRVIQWIARMVLLAALIIAVALFLGYATPWMWVLVLGLGGAGVALYLALTDN